jgi:hypothetical protein
MSPMFRLCPECDGERLFEQPHDVPGGCPDSPDGNCPEWSCAECGAALLAGFPPRAAGRAPLIVRVHGKVA